MGRPVQYRVTMVVRDYVLSTMLRLFHCLTNFDWADKNWAEMAEQLGKIKELQKYCQQNVVSDHHGLPVQCSEINDAL